MRQVVALAILSCGAFVNNALWSAEPRLAANFGKLPLSFEPNRGQTDKQATFIARGSGYSLFLTPDGAVLSLRGTSPLRITFVGSKSGGRLEGAESQLGTSNYFLGNDPEKWVTNVPHFGKVKRLNVWDGIDAVYYGQQGNLEYDLVVAPNANPAQIRLRFKGHKRLRLDHNGDLVIEMPHGELRQLAAVFYEGLEGQRKPVKGRYVLHSANEVGVFVEQYDKCQTLVIDPALAYSTYLGGSGSTRLTQ